MEEPLQATMDKKKLWAIADYCDEKEIEFIFQDRQMVFCYLNKFFEDREERFKIARVILKHSELNWDLTENYFELKWDINDYKFYYMLKKYGVDINDFGISLDFAFNNRNELQSKIHDEAMTSDQLRQKYQDYKLEFIWEPLIVKHGINIMGAERGSGKTRIALSLAFNIIYGESDFIGYQISDWGAVLYLNFEIHEPEFKLVLDPIARFFEKNGAKRKHDLRVMSFLSAPDFKIHEIERLVETYKPSLVIVDSFKAFASRVLLATNTRELTNLNADLIYKHFNAWKKCHNVTILVLNHTNKGTKSQKAHSDLMFGPSSFTDFADHTFLIRKTDTPNQRLLIPDKTRFASEGSTVKSLIEICSGEEPEDMLWIELIEDNVKEEDHSYSGKEVKYTDDQRMVVLQMHQQGQSSRSISTELNIPRTTVQFWVNNFKNKSPP